MAEQSVKHAKRQVKNPETFRERALKATEATDSPHRAKRLGGAIGRPFKWVFSPVGRFFRKLFSVQPFKTIAKIGHWLGLILLPVYFRNSWKELRLVSWPTFRQSLQLTYAVLAFAVVFGGAVALVDLGLDKVFKSILLK